MNKNTFITYKFYDEQGRRLAIFGEYLPEYNFLEVSVFTCSKKDFFSKKKAKAAYDILCKSVTECNEANFHPMLDSFEVIGTTPQKAFLEYCNDKFCRKFHFIMKSLIVRNVFRNKDAIISTKDEIDYSRTNKMDACV